MSCIRSIFIHLMAMIVYLRKFVGCVRSRTLLEKPFRKIKRNWKILKEMMGFKKDFHNKSWKKML